MRFAALGYFDEGQWEALSEQEQQGFMDECFAYDDVLRENHHFAGGEALDATSRAVTVRWRDGEVAITDGPYAEAKEVLGGILMLEARDLDHAVELIAKHPGVKAGGFEIRPIVDMTELVAASRSRRVGGGS